LLLTFEIKRIANYTGLNFDEVLNLNYGAYMLYRKESWIDVMNQSKEGRELLKNLWRYKQTDADEDKIREFSERGRR
jgi:hypothetical protein